MPSFDTNSHSQKKKSENNKSLSNRLDEISCDNPIREEGKDENVEIPANQSEKQKHFAKIKERRLHRVYSAYSREEEKN